MISISHSWYSERLICPVELHIMEISLLRTESNKVPPAYLSKLKGVGSNPLKTRGHWFETQSL
jgi:hypothetical protein